MTRITEDTQEMALLPCPFCGDDAPYMGNGRNRRWNTVVCYGCSASTGPRGTETQAVEAWNTRASQLAGVPSIFDLLEPLARRIIANGGPDLRGYYARGTGGVDLEPLIDELAGVVGERDALFSALQYARNLVGPDEVIDAALEAGNANAG